ncbi:MAG: glycosyltransferase [Bacteroidales bacterium]|nr:glycosyltransferase [Bacteroidales bacterium]
MLITILYILCMLICITYVIMTITISYGWYSLKTYKLSGKELRLKISVIIAAKNEEDNIGNCLNDLINQDYPKELFEVIIVDDCSTDNTYSITKSFIEANSAEVPKITLIKSDKWDQLIAGKKEAIRSGVNISSGEIIITSDADCRFKSKWLSIISDYFENNDIKLLTGAVAFPKSNNIFNNLQSLEFLSLIASAAGFARAGKPILSNAANLCFYKNTFLEVEKFRTDYDHASGDDIFLLLHIKKLYGASKINFLKNYDTIVYTDAISSIKGFFSQRMRWVSKSRKYKDPIITFVVYVTFFYNSLLLTGFLISIFHYRFFPFFILLLLIKIIADLPVMAGITYFNKRSELLWFLIPLEIINILYVVIIAVAGYFFKAKWKNKDVY